MAKTKEAPQPAPQPAADSGGGSQLAVAPTHDELAALGEGLEFPDDGLGPTERGDIKVAAYVLNFGGQSKDGRAIPKDEFYNTVDERSKHKVRLVFLHRHISNLYGRYNQAEKKTEVICRSPDRVTGIWQADQHERPCEGCPDAVWRTVEGKRTRNCSEVFNMYAVDLDESLGFVVRFKRTGLPVIRSYLQKHHLGRRIVKGVRSNYPLYVFEAEMTGKMKGETAVPEIVKKRLLTLEEVALFREQAQSVRDIVVPMLAHLDAQADRDTGSEGGDTSFDPAKMAADEGRDFADPA